MLHIKRSVSLLCPLNFPSTKTFDMHCLALCCRFLCGAAALVQMRNMRLLTFLVPVLVSDDRSRQNLVACIDKCRLDLIWKKNKETNKKSFTWRGEAAMSSAVTYISVGVFQAFIISHLGGKTK